MSASYEHASYEQQAQVPDRVPTGNVPADKVSADKVPVHDARLIRAALRDDLVAAMKARRRDAVTALRTAIAAIDNAEALTALEVTPTLGDGPIAGATTGLGSSEAQRRVLSAPDVVALVEAEIAERRAASEEIEEAGRPDRAADLRREADVIEAALRFP